MVFTGIDHGRFAMKEIRAIVRDRSDWNAFWRLVNGIKGTFQSSASDFSILRMLRIAFIRDLLIHMMLCSIRYSHCQVDRYVDTRCHGLRSGALAYRRRWFFRQWTQDCPRLVAQVSLLTFGGRPYGPQSPDPLPRKTAPGRACETADPHSTSLRAGSRARSAKKHSQEWSAELQIPRLRSG
jgi:hypothetical protein